jgi:hypothetical protein
MTISDSIRKLASEGCETAEIARRLGIRYQHAYNVLKTSSPKARSSTESAKNPNSLLAKPALSVETLKAAGFVLSSRWLLSPENELAIETPLPKDVGVYAFVRGSIACYVGVATMGLAKRLYFYAKPGVTQRTSVRLNQILKGELVASPSIEIYTATPSDLEWNGLPVHGSAGLELGLIKKYDLPWNLRSAK